MNVQAWKSRLAAAVEASGKSKRSISEESGHGPGYLHSILVEGKEPKITNLIAICEAIPTSVTYIIHGLDVSPEDEELLKALYKNPQKRAAIQSLIRSDVREEDTDLA